MRRYVKESRVWRGMPTVCERCGRVRRCCRFPMMSSWQGELECFDCLCAGLYGEFLRMFGLAYTLHGEGRLRLRLLDQARLKRASELVVWTELTEAIRARYYLTPDELVGISLEAYVNQRCGHLGWFLPTLDLWKADNGSEFVILDKVLSNLPGEGWRCRKF